MTDTDNVARTYAVLGTKYLISAQDMSRAIEFYTHVFGLEIATESPWWSELRHGTAIVALHGGGTGEFRNTGLSFTVDDIDAACTSVERYGGKLRSGPEDRGDEGIILADVTDTEGNGIMISQPK